MVRSLRRPHPAADDAVVANATALWVLGLTLLGLDLLALPFSGFTLDRDVVLNQNVMLAAVLLPFALFYTYHRYDRAVSSLLGTVCIMSGLIPILCVMTYLAGAAGARFPLYDDALAALDEGLGFRWPALLAWADAHPFWADVAGVAYRSFVCQAIVMAVTLSVLGQAKRLQTVVYAFALAGVLCGVVSCLMPALGTYAHYGIDASHHPHIDLQVKGLTFPTVLELRSGHFGILSAGRSQGIVTFPSFHAVLGVLLGWAFWRTWGLRWCALALNVALIAGTPLQGSHYLVDVLAGLAVAVVAILAASRLHAWVAALARRRRGRGRAGGLVLANP